MNKTPTAEQVLDQFAITLDSVADLLETLRRFRPVMSPWSLPVIGQAMTDVDHMVQDLAVYLDRFKDAVPTDEQGTWEGVDVGSTEAAFYRRQAAAERFLADQESADSQHLFVQQRGRQFMDCSLYCNDLVGHTQQSGCVLYEQAQQIAAEAEYHDEDIHRGER